VLRLDRPRDLTGWVWGTADQVVALMGTYEPAILTATPPSVAGGAYFGTATAFLSAMRWTGFVSLYGGYSEWTAGWTASTDDAGLPIQGRVGFGWWPPGGGFSAVGRSEPIDAYGGVWLWRPAGVDDTPPVITPTVAGTTGNADWYVSDVSVTWDVHDAESAISSQAGCDPASVGSDTAGTAITCEATSTGGASTASAVVKRDTTAPTVTCASPAPVFELYQVGAWVTAAVADATSGPAAGPAQGAANTGAPGTFTTTITGADRAGNRTTTTCSYEVVVPTCRGLTPTRVGTALNDVISGTSGRDVIVGLGGADTVNGFGGDDVICGGDGPDKVDGGAGNDTIDGGASPDDLSGGAGDDTIDGGAGNDSIQGGNGRDRCTSGELRMSSCEL
jgi:Ca2+-binding RTX toxin-like protein